jgi:hypothetical protein
MGIEPQFLGRATPGLVTRPTTLPHFHFLIILDENYMSENRPKGGKSPKNVCEILTPNTDEDSSFFVCFTIKTEILSSYKM